jgi:hypothetical protein
VASPSPTSTCQFRTCEEPLTPIPVVQLGTGNVGVHALRALITNPEFEPTGVWVCRRLPEHPTDCCMEVVLPRANRRAHLCALS